MKTIKRILLGLIYMIPFSGIGYWMVHLFMTDPNMLKTVQYTGYVFVGLCLLFMFFIGALAIFSSTLMGLRHLFNLKKREVVKAEAKPDLADKVSDNI